MSESDSMRRKLIEEDIMSGSKMCGFEAASTSKSKTEGGKNYHQTVRRVSSMPITCSPSVSMQSLFAIFTRLKVQVSAYCFNFNIIYIGWRFRIASGFIQLLHPSQGQWDVCLRNTFSSTHISVISVAY